MMTYSKRHNSVLSNRKWATLARAFTLIQLMFVIAIGAAATVYTMQTYNNDIYRSRVERTALEIQRILEAGLHYYRKNSSTWPATINELSNKKYLPPMPLGVMLNPWGQAYVTFPLATWNGTQFVFRFYVTTNVVTANAAQRLAKLLPNAVVTGTTVQAFVESTKVTTLQAAVGDGAILVKVNQGISISALNVSASHNCTLQADYTATVNTCKNSFNRKADFEVALTGFNTGSVYDGTETASIVQYGADYNEVYVQKDPSNLGCFDFIIAHPYSWEYTNQPYTYTIPNAHLNRGVYGQVVAFFYCKNAAAGPPP